MTNTEGGAFDFDPDDMMKYDLCGMSGTVYILIFYLFDPFSDDT
jgi:hypothetical protein